MVFYLKYRPKKIGELDSADLREKLNAALTGKLPDNIPHAFLFSGPKGLGKTSTARILAKAINCKNRKENEIEPCNKCDICISIDNGSSLDVIEIDGASNRGIDEIRDLKEKIRLAPHSAKKKIYIIDEVHMLTTEAFNALLKTLEEPPSHAVFVLCTTESHKLPETIVSRCFAIKFLRATDEDLVSSFERIVKGENGKADKEALNQVASLSDGSFRDGAKILEELFTYSDKITQDLLEEKYKTQSIRKYLDDFIKSLNEKDAKKSIEIIKNMGNSNIDFKFFTQELIYLLHSNLVEEISSGKDANNTKKLIELFIGAGSSIKYSLIPQLPLELAVVEWNSELESSPRIENAKTVEKAKEKDLPQVEAVKKTNNKASKNDNILESLIEMVKAENFSVAGVLRGCKVESFDDNTLSLSTNFAFHKEKLSDKKVVDLIEKMLEESQGKKIKFMIDLRG